MKTCRTYKGLLAAIKAKEPAQLKYTDMSKTSGGGCIVYLQNGTNLILSHNGYEEIKDHLVKI